MSMMSKEYFHNETKAFEHLEKVLWNGQPTCPKCGAVDRIYTLDGVKDKIGRVRLGLKKCGHCKSQFTVRVGTVFESAHIPLTKILQAVYLMCASKKGISAHQMHRTLEITYKSAWFLCHRIREAMRDGSLAPMGGNGSVVEVDETYIGRDHSVPKRGGTEHKFAVLTLVERNGRARSFQIERATQNTVMPIVMKNVRRESAIMTDEGRQYWPMRDVFASHGVVNHSINEYARGKISSNTVEGYFSIFKRGMKGVYQHCAEKHLHRYLAEFDFRYSNRVALGTNDEGRTAKALLGVTGKRLSYRRIGQHA
jgi:transposase-like protein